MSDSRVNFARHLTRQSERTNKQIHIHNCSSQLPTQLEISSTIFVNLLIFIFYNDFLRNMIIASQPNLRIISNFHFQRSYPDI